ncbi:MAG: nuclear transport factor 2 family protein [Pseudonocardiaceae bacterium]
MSQQLQDQLDVMDVCTRMAWYTDRRQWDRLAEVFTDEVAVDYTSLAGGAPGSVSRDELVGSWRELLGGMTATQHLVSNHLVTVDGDAAECTAQFQATHIAEVPHGEDRWILGGHYRYALTRATQGWQIRSLTMTVAWSSGNQAILGGAASTPEAGTVAVRFLEALSRSDIDTVADCFAEDAVQEMPFAPPDFPNRLEGRETLRKLYGGLPEANRSMDFPVHSVRPFADPEWVLVEFDGKIEQFSGATYDNHYFGLFRVLDGQIRHYREIFNPLVLTGSMSEAGRESTFSLDSAG